MSRKVVLCCLCICTGVGHATVANALPFWRSRAAAEPSTKVRREFLRFRSLAPFIAAVALTLPMAKPAHAQDGVLRVLPGGTPRAETRAPVEVQPTHEYCYRRYYPPPRVIIIVPPPGFRPVPRPFVELAPYPPGLYSPFEVVPPPVYIGPGGYRPFYVEPRRPPHYYEPRPPPHMTEPMRPPHAGGPMGPHGPGPAGPHGPEGPRPGGGPHPR
jgi:hypothetical protein